MMILQHVYHVVSQFTEFHFFYNNYNLSSVFADDLSRGLCCGVALPGGACVFSCKRARQHDQRVDMIIVGSHVILKCLDYSMGKSIRNS